jgi:hypothetical protein
MIRVNLITAVALAAVAFSALGVEASAERVARVSSGLSRACPTVKTVTGNEFLYKSELSQHISSGDPRATGPTFICNRLCGSFPMPILYSDGTEAARLGYYGTWRVTGKPRAYCGAGGVPTCSNSTLSSQSRRRGRNGKLYVKINRNTCYQVNPVGRTGSPT